METISQQMLCVHRLHEIQSPIAHFSRPQFMPPSPKRSMDTFKESQLHGNDRNHFIQNGGSAPQSNLADSSAADAAKPEISGDSTPNVLNTDELFRMAPDMVPLQQKAEELMYSSQVLVNGALIFER
jgi:hypothetical protein